MPDRRNAQRASEKNLEFRSHPRLCCIAMHFHPGAIIQAQDQATHLMDDLLKFSGNATRPSASVSIGAWAGRPATRHAVRSQRSSAECVGCHNSGLGGSAGPAASIQAHTTKRITKARHAVANANAARCIGLYIVASKVLVSGRVTVCSSSGRSIRRHLSKARVRGVAREFCH
jgi:hypothetical protein